MIPEIRTDPEKIERKTGEANEVLSYITTYRKIYVYSVCR
jgi:hypothetical protein